MTRTCVVCKRQPIPHDTSRSFHKFPDDNVFKQKWLIIVGKTSTSINSCVCSDHFTNDSFHPTYELGFTTRRRLLPDAVPVVIRNSGVLIDLTNTVDVPTIKDEVDSQFGDKIGDSEVLEDITNTVVVSTIKDEVNSQYGDEIGDSEVLEDTTNIVFVPTIKDEVDSQCGDEIGDSEVLEDITNTVFVSTIKDEVDSQCGDEIGDSEVLEDITNTVVVSTIKDEVDSQCGDEIGDSEVLEDNTNTVVVSTIKDEVDSQCGDEIGDSEVLEDITNPVVVPTIKDEFDSQSGDEIGDSEVLEDTNSTIDEPLNKDDFDSHPEESDLNIKINNRKRPYPFKTGDLTNKRFRFKDGVQTEHIKRADFVSDEAWERFHKFTIYKNKQVTVLRTKYFRKNKKIDKLTKIIEKLKKMENFAAAEYLQDLPEYLKELISRMKDKKSTVPFSPNLKKFAKSLHVCSPVAYEMMRRSYFQCLPCVETLNRWNSSENNNPGVCEEVINQ